MRDEPAVSQRMHYHSMELHRSAALAACGLAITHADMAEHHNMTQDSTKVDCPGCIKHLAEHTERILRDNNRCPFCNGVGEQQVPTGRPTHEGGEDWDLEPCAACNGTGVFIP